MDSTEIVAEGVGGQYEITYSLEDIAFAPENWTVDCDVEWIRGCDFSKEGVIVVNVLANDLLEDRSAVITLSYSGIAEGYQVTVKQKAGSVDSSDIILEKDEIMVSDEGGEHTVKYTIKNPIVGINIKVKANVPWITLVQTNVEGEVTFKTRWNFMGLREAEITLVYGDKVERSFRVIQQEGSTDKAFIELSFSDIKQSTAVLKVVPADDEMYYGILTVASTVLENDYESNEACVDEWLRGMKMVAGFMGMTLEDLLRRDLPKGERMGLLTYLPGGTEISVLIFGIEPSDQSYLTEIVVEKFVTQEVPMLDVTFDLDMELNGAIADISVVPSDNDIRYFFNVEETSICNPQGTVEYQLWLYAVAGLTIDEALDQICIVGKNEKRFPLDPNKAYTAYACTINEEGLINCEVATLDFVTEDVQMSDNKIEITVDELSGTSAVLKVNTTNDDYYVIAVGSPKIFDGVSDDKAVDDFIMNNVMYCDMMTRSGNVEEPMSGLTPSTEYVAFAFGYYRYSNGYVRTTSPVKVYFTTTSEAGNVSLQAPVVEKKGIKALDTEDMRKRYEMERYLRMLGR